MERSEITHHTFILVLLVGMDSLRMLTQVIEARKLLSAVTRERTFASVFSVERGDMGEGGWVSKEGEN